MQQQAPLDFIPWPRQQEVFKAFLDDETHECLFGGSVNCGKTYILCVFLLYVCQQYPGTRWGLGRTDLSNLKKTTLTKFWQVCEDLGFKRGKDFQTAHIIYREHKNEIEFGNGSKILLLDLYYYPSDEAMVTISGLDLTGACIDEANELDGRVRDKVFERCDRWKNRDYKLKPFLLMTANPGKNFLYDDFYMAAKQGTLPKSRKYIFSTMLDVPGEFEDIHAYKERLRLTKTPADYQRMVLGNWEYEDHSDALIPYTNILALWDNTPTTGTRYISADIALEGSDRLVFAVWEGLTLIRVVAVEKPERGERNPKEVIQLLQELMRTYKVDEANVCFDSDGVGSYIRGWLPRARAIKNGSKAKLDESFENLKAQMYFKLADYINEGRISILDKTYKKEITQELEQVRKAHTGDGRPLNVVKKDEVKKIIKRSPDFSDALAYRLLFELIPVNHGKYTYDFGEL